MFEDSLFATNRRRTPQQRWAAVASFLLQTAFVTLLVALPLFFTEALPIEYVRSFVELPEPPHAPPPVNPAGPRIRPQQVLTEYEDGRFVFHRPAPGPMKPVVDPPGGGAEPYSGPTVPGGIYTGPENGNSTVNEILSGIPHPVAGPPVHTKPVIVSRMDEGLLIRKVTPVYPHIATITHTQGTVVLHAIIGRDGSIQQLQAISGHPLLIKAAMDAVSQWRYKPYKLNGEPVEVDTTITVNFKLGG
jgi:protein TonB